MSASCPRCDADPPAGSRFCPQCGIRLGADGMTAVIPPAGATFRDRAAVIADRGRGLLDILRTGAEARRQLIRLRGERERLLGQRRGLLLALGEAVYAGDDGETTSLRARLEELDTGIEERERDMERIAAEAQSRVARTRFETDSTQILLPTAVEPYPSPGEADPPEPARVPEPYPPPGEADPPQPVRVPEPYPPPDEGDPPEPARIPEPSPPDAFDNIR